MIFPIKGNVTYPDPNGVLETATLGVAVGTNGVMLVEHGDNNHAPNVMIHYMCSIP